MPVIEAFYTKKLNCPICGHAFSSQKVRSRAVTPTKIDSDFCAYYRDEQLNPNHYVVYVCPDCGYAFTEEFSANFPAGTKELIKSKITANWEKRNYSGVRNFVQAIDVYKLAILAATLKKEKHIVMGNLCLRLAWLYRIEGNSGQEERFLKLTLKEYEESYLSSDFLSTPMTELRIMFMIGEISRRVKDYQKAISYFSKIIEHPKRSTEQKMVNMAREQWTEAIEEYRKLNKQEESK